MGYFELFKYATFREKLVLYGGIFFSIANGAIQPTYGLVIMQIVKVFNPSLTNPERVDMMID